MKGIYAALTTLVVTLIVALFVFELPARVSAGAITEGVVAGIFPIGIVLMADGARKNEGFIPTVSLVTVWRP